MKTKIAITLLMAVSLSLSAVYAQKPGYDYSHQNHERQGYHKNGNINQHEARDLARKKKDLQKKIRHARSNDGRISRAERKRIEREWRAMNRDAQRYSNNNRNRNRY